MIIPRLVVKSYEYNPVWLLSAVRRKHPENTFQISRIHEVIPHKVFVIELMLLFLNLLIMCLPHFL